MGQTNVSILRERQAPHQGTLQKQGCEQFFQTMPHSSASATLWHLRDPHTLPPGNVGNSQLEGLPVCYVAFVQGKTSVVRIEPACSGIIMGVCQSLAPCWLLRHSPSCVICDDSTSQAKL